MLSSTISILLLSLIRSDIKTVSLQPKLTVSRRHALLSVPGTTLLPFISIPGVANAAGAAPDLQFSTTSTGLQWADAKIGTGTTKKKGDAVAIDYVMSTTGARYGTKIYSNKDSPSAPYRWVLGDGSTIAGLEEAVVGNVADGMPPMMPGGVRRIIVPANLAYESLAKVSGGGGMQVEDCRSGSGVGPVPPIDESLAEFQRFKNIYCNQNRPYQPDLVMDVKMYGKRTLE